MFPDSKLATISEINTPIGTDNIAKGPAMSRAMAVRSVESGIDVAFALSAKYKLIAIH